MGKMRAKLRAFHIAWTVVWAGGVVFLLIYWQHLPIRVSWPLAILEALLVPDFKVLKEQVFERIGSKESHDT
jgi:hypothetical protein